MNTKLARLLLALASLCLTLLLLEGVARFLPPPYPAQPDAPFYICHDTLGWSGRPNFAGPIAGIGFEQTATFNALGMHDTDHQLPKPPETFRLLILGDSFVQAVQVSEAETTHQVLEDYLNIHQPGTSPHVEVISAGVINWGTNQELLYYRQQGRHFAPDLTLLLVYIGNDLLDNLPGNLLTIDGFNCYAPYFARCDGALTPDPLTYAPGISSLQGDCGPFRRGLVNGMGALYQSSRLYRQLEPLLIMRYPRQQFGRIYPSAFSALYLPNDEAELAEAWAITLATIAQLRTEVEVDGGKFAVALISPGVVLRLRQMPPAERDLFLAENPSFAAVQADKPNVRLAEFFEQEGIVYTDLSDPLAAAPLYFVEDGHWTVEGNRVAGETLARWLIANNLIP